MFLDELPLPAGYAARLRALREVVDTLDRQLALLDREISAAGAFYISDAGSSLSLVRKISDLSDGRHTLSPVRTI